MTYNRRPSFRSQVYNHLIHKGKRLTPLESFSLFGMGDLSTALRDITNRLKKERSPYTIEAEYHKDDRGRRYAEYRRKRLSTA